MQPTISFNNKVKQVIILVVLVVMIYLALKELYIFLPGLLGALTLYILSRGSYFQLIYHRKWKKGWTAGMYLMGYFLLLGLLVFITISLVEKRIHPFLNDPGALLKKAEAAISEIQQKTGFNFFSEQTLTGLQKKLSDFLPSLLNDTVNLITNIAVMLFMLYYMLVHGKEMESYIGRVIPLKQSNINVLAYETKRIVKASALGIPIISIIQGVTATIGYIIFDVHEYIIFGFLTGVFAFFPVVGTMIMWVPLVLYMYASGDTWNATGLLLYSFIIT